MNHENEINQAEAIESADQMQEQDHQHDELAHHEEPIQESHEQPSSEKKREPQDNYGSLFKNDRRKNESHPHVTGSAMIAGQEFYVSGWRKAGQKGDFYSLSFRPKQTEAKDLI